MEISFKVLTIGDKESNAVSQLIEVISWSAGKSLSTKMIQQEFSGWEAVLVGWTTNQEMACFCTVTKLDSLQGEEYTPFIGYVFVQEKFRGFRLSERLLKAAESYLKKVGFEGVFLVSGEIGLYEKFGYSKIANAETIHGETENVYRKFLIEAPYLFQNSKK